LSRLLLNLLVHLLTQQLDIRRRETVRAHDLGRVAHMLSSRSHVNAELVADRFRCLEEHWLLALRIWWTEDL
jgi:hypothetical protein